MIGFLIGAGVGLVAGAGLGAIVMGLLANARVEAATTSEMKASRLAVEALTKAAELQERCDALVAELDALSIAGPPGIACTAAREGLDTVPVEVWTDKPTGLLVNADTHAHPETCQVHIGGRCNCEVGEAIRARRRLDSPNHRPGMAIYPKPTPREGK